MHITALPGVPFGVVINKFDGTYRAAKEYCATEDIRVLAEHAASVPGANG